MAHFHHCRAWRVINPATLLAANDALAIVRAIAMQN